MCFQVYEHVPTCIHVCLRVCCRRLLQMGVYNAELFNNLGLCCFYAQQYDMTLTCFERALSLADDQTLPDVWFNIGHVALVSSECSLVGLVVKASASGVEDPRFNPACAEIFPGSSYTSDLNIGTPMATLPGAWRYRVSAGTGRPGVSIL